MSVPPARSVAGGGFGRDEALRRLGAEQFDVLVVGGGVTGAGVALDAASRGLKTALVERRDFASGTSSKSSKMVHGGLRYLQQRELRLVYENLAERQRLLDNAPHLVSPLPFLIPLFGRDGVVAKAVARSYSTALWLYDLTGGVRIGSRHRRVDRQQVLAHLPTLDTDRLVAGFLYFDARADDARLTLSLVRSAVLDHGAVAANDAPVESLLEEGGRVVGARLRPAGAGDPAGGPAGGPGVDVAARVVVNATGVWADGVAALEGAGPARPTLRPAKGVHVTVPAARLPCDIASVIPVAKDRRSIFVVPWAEGGLVYVGTTDTDYAGPLDDPRCEPEDVDYLLAAVNAVTTSQLTRADVTGVWAGLRPLLAPVDGRHLSERTSDLSRRHTVVSGPDGVVTVTGGKLTTYRKMAEDTLEAVLRLLEDPPASARRCRTRRLALRGAPGPDDGPAALRAADPVVAAHLFARYGTEAGDVLAVADGRPDLLEPAVPGLPYLRAELVYAVRAEMARGLDDVLARRTRAAIQDARATAAAATAVAELLAPELGWSPERAAAEAVGYAERLRAELAAAGLPDPADSPVGGGQR
ncbi:MAG: glycerol-3-phosphate dehydrogenase/oxidase [Acidimicrobiales bacterium]